jgi:hypothetical protein
MRHVHKNHSDSLYRSPGAEPLTAGHGHERSIPVGRDTGSPDIVWRPTPFYLERSRLGRFMRRHGMGSVDELLRRSASDIEWFWEATVRDLELEWFEPYSRVLDLSGGVEWPRWFVGGRYNHVHDAVDRQAQRRPGSVALVWEGEDGQVQALTFARLSAEVNRAANALRALGISPGDRVGWGPSTYPSSRASEQGPWPSASRTAGPHCSSPPMAFTGRAGGCPWDR